MTSVFALLVILVVSSEGLSLPGSDTSLAGDSPGVVNCGQNNNPCLQRKESLEDSEGPTVTRRDGDTKTFSLISHLLGKIPFFNKNHEATATISTSNAVPSIPVATVSTGKK